MATTNPTVIVPADQTLPAGLGRHLSRILTGLGVVAAVAVLFVVLDDSDSASTDVVGPGVRAVQPESITAIDHRAEATARANRGGITAIDHRAATAGD